MLVLIAAVSAASSAGAPSPVSDTEVASAAGPAGASRPANAATPATAAGAGSPVGVADARRAWQNWTLNCQGCHRIDGSGDVHTTPALAGTVARFLAVPGGREYLGRVPGVATSPLADEDLAELVNWMLWRFDPMHLPADFQPYTAVELHALRASPLRLEASQRRAELLAALERSKAP